MTTAIVTVRSVLARGLVPALIVLALAGCAAGTGATASSKTPTPSATTAEPCDDVTVIVDFGTLDSPSLKKCGAAGVASATLKDAGITTEGTADYGDQVVCRVDDLPSKTAESCAKLPSAAYWALWIKKSADGDWAYADEGVSTQQVTAGESLGLVYTVGADSTPPQD